MIDASHPTPLRAWKLAPTPLARRAFPDVPAALWAVEYSDGSGNVLLPDGHPLYVAGTPFRDEPRGHMDPALVVATAVSPSLLPSP